MTSVLVPSVCKKTKMPSKKNRMEWYANFNPGEHPDKVGYSGILHRENGPAVECEETQVKSWFHMGVLHRENGPAIEASKPRMNQWYKSGILHREDGPAICAPGDGLIENTAHHVRFEQKNVDNVSYDRFYFIQQAWIQHGLLHREDGPALICQEGNDKTVFYYTSGKKHRLDGPAEIYINLITKEERHGYYVNNQYLGHVNIRSKKNNQKVESWFVNKEDAKLIYVLHHQKIREAAEQKQHILQEISQVSEVKDKVSAHQNNKKSTKRKI